MCGIWQSLTVLGCCVRYEVAIVFCCCVRYVVATASICCVRYDRVECCVAV